MIKVDAPKIREIELRLGWFKVQASSVLAKSINRSAENARTNMSKKVREQYIVKDKDIKETIKFSKASKNKLGASVKSIGFKEPLYKFKVSPKKPRPQKPPKVLKAQVRKSGSLKAILGAFVANVDGVNRVMERVEKKRLPIQQLFGPSIPQMVENPDVIGYVEREAKSTLDKRIDHEIRRVLEAKRK